MAVKDSGRVVIRSENKYVFSRNLEKSVWLRWSDEVGGLEIKRGKLRVINDDSDDDTLAPKAYWLPCTRHGAKYSHALKFLILTATLLDRCHYDLCCIIEGVEHRSLSWSPSSLGFKLENQDSTPGHSAQSLPLHQCAPIHLYKEFCGNKGPAVPCPNRETIAQSNGLLRDRSVVDCSPFHSFKGVVFLCVNQHILVLLT
jgi:hypothetical protein